MAALVTTYAVAWVVVAAYVARLTIGNKRLSRRLEQLKESVENDGDRKTPSRRLAG